MSDEMGDEMGEVINEFLVEGHEALDRLDRDLVGLENDPRSAETIASIFRTVHTIKGTCGFLGFERLERLAHAAENLLGKLRDGELVVDVEIVSALLATVMLFGRCSARSSARERKAMSITPS